MKLQLLASFVYHWKFDEATVTSLSSVPHTAWAAKEKKHYSHYDLNPIFSSDIASQPARGSADTSQVYVNDAHIRAEIGEVDSSVEAPCHITLYYDNADGVNVGSYRFKLRVSEDNQSFVEGNVGPVTHEAYKEAVKKHAKEHETRLKAILTKFYNDCQGRKELEVKTKAEGKPIVAGSKPKMSWKDLKNTSRLALTCPSFANRGAVKKVHRHPSTVQSVVQEVTRQSEVQTGLRPKVTVGRR